MAKHLISLISSQIGLTREEATFTYFLLVSLFVAVLYGRILHPHRVSPVVRHLVSWLLGMYIGFYSYSWSMFHLIAQATICYILLQILSPKIVHKVVFIVAILYLSVEHVRQLISNHTADLDHIGPMMIITARITSLAFGLHDGKEFLSSVYSTAVACLAVGPFCFYKDYIDFIEGKHVIPFTKKTDDGKEIVIYKEPPVMNVVVKKTCVAVCIVATILSIGPYYLPIGNVDPAVLNSSIAYRLWYLWISVVLFQAKYIFAWTIADAICNASGFGFNGYHSNGEPKWNLVTNINCSEFFTCQNLKQTKDTWHMTVNPYMRYAAFDRVSVPRLKLFSTLLLSCIWHGFYPGYFWTSGNAFLTTIVSKQGRQKIRPYFLSSKESKRVYDIITLIFHQINVVYIFIPFALLSNEYIITFYSSCYFIGHIIVFTILVVAIAIPSKKVKKESATNDVLHTNSMPLNSALQTNNKEINGNAKNDNNLHHRKYNEL
uniref:Membrane-bound O-acyltransferase domain-containing protein 2-like n=1 Tax=Saccoglossus kowalevskii TaxID=10224 RepID=A0ABM0MUW2_SACKO|nr:PREDICTED: membrane-bound O-acyltransferase domain-containing protein 2-like [Saccoglossus kowalevskii]